MSDGPRTGEAPLGQMPDAELAALAERLDHACAVLGGQARCLASEAHRHVRGHVVAVQFGERREAHQVGEEEGVQTAMSHALQA